MTVQSVDRAIDLLELIAEEPAKLVELSVDSGLPVSTVARLLATLQGRGAVARNEAGAYLIGPSVQSLAQSAPPPVPSLEDLSSGELSALAEELDEAACLSVPEGNRSVTVLQFDTPKDVRAVDWTGRRWSLTGGGSGQVLLATWSADRVDRAIEHLPEAERQAVRQELIYVRSRGIAWSRETHVKGLNSVAAAIVDANGIGVGSVVAYGPSYRFPEKGLVRNVEQAVIAAASAISKKLGS